MMPNSSSSGFAEPLNMALGRQRESAIVFPRSILAPDSCMLRPRRFAGSRTLLDGVHGDSCRSRPAVKATLVERLPSRESARAALRGQMERLDTT